LNSGQTLSILLPAPATVRWGVDGWLGITDTPTRDSGLGVHVADLSTQGLVTGQYLDFTFLWSAPERWEGKDFRINIA